MPGEHPACWFRLAAVTPSVPPGRNDAGRPGWNAPLPIQIVTLPPASTVPPDCEKAPLVAAPLAVPTVQYLSPTLMSPVAITMLELSASPG